MSETPYIVEWCDETGVLQERPFASLEDAKLEAADLNDKYVYVRIRDANGNTIADTQLSSNHQRYTKKGGNHHEGRFQALHPPDGAWRDHGAGRL